MNFFPALLLTAFISIDGAVAEVPLDSPQAIEYTMTDTDIGDDVYEMEEPETELEEGEIEDDTLESLPDTDGTVYVIENNNEEITELLNEQIELLAENSSAATGTLNTTVLDLMDRMVDDSPSYFKYAGFRTNADDAYESILYLSKNAKLNGDTIQFGDDCIAVHFYRNQYSNYNYYVTYERYESPNATVRITNDSIIYTNVADGFPSLGNHFSIPEEYLWIGVFLIIASILFNRRMNNA